MRFRWGKAVALTAKGVCGVADLREHREHRENREMRVREKGLNEMKIQRADSILLLR